MEPENTLRNMALYDFKTPINVIFYDDETSDDEKKSKNAVITQNNAVIKEEKLQETSENNKDDSLVMSSMPKISENKERNKHVEECIPNKTENSKKKCYKMERGKRKSNDLFGNDEVIKQKNNTHVPNTLATSQHNNITLDRLSPNLLRDNDDIMEEPLKSVSNFLIILAESYNYHISISNKRPIKNKEVSKKHYLEIKYHVFKTAHQVVNANIIPKEKDQIFIDEFLNNTIKMADKKTKCDTSSIIKNLFTELIKWVKERKRQGIKVKPKSGDGKEEKNSKKPNSLLIEKLSQPPILNFTNMSPENQQHHNTNGNTVINTTKNQNKDTPTCTLTPELPGEEISIDFSTALSNNQNNKTIINNDTSRDENILTQNPLPASELFQYMQNCNYKRNRNNGLTGTDTHIDVRHNNVQPIATEIAHNNLPTTQNNNTVYNNGISCDENIGSQNPLASSQLLYYLQNSNSNRPLNNGPTDTIPLVNNNMVQPNTNQIVHNHTINNISYQQTPSTYSNALCSQYVHKNNACSSSIAPGLRAVSLNNTASNLIDARQPTSNSSYQQTPSTDANALCSQSVCSSAIAPWLRGNSSNNTAVNLMDARRHTSNSSYQQTPSTDANALCSQYVCSAAIAPCLRGNSSNNTAVNLMDARQPTSNSSYQQTQAPSSRAMVRQSTYYHKDIPVSSSTPPRSYQNTVRRHTSAKQRRINDSNSNSNHNSNPNDMHLLQHNTTNVLWSNQGVNNHYHSRPSNAICANSIAANNNRPAPPPYTATRYLPDQNRNYPLNNLTNFVTANTPLCLPSNNRPISSSIIHRSHSNFLENTTHSSETQEVTVQLQPLSYSENRRNQAHLVPVYSQPIIQQNQDVTVQRQPLPYRENRRDQAPLVQDNSPPIIQQNQDVTVQRQPLSYCENQRDQTPLVHDYSPPIIQQNKDVTVQRQPLPYRENQRNQAPLVQDYSPPIIQQNQDVTVQRQPLPYRENQSDQAPLVQDYSPHIIQQNVQPHRSRSSFSTDSGFASPVPPGDGGNSMEDLMNSIFDLEETTEQTDSLPVITHVTSLSTKVAFVKEGSCYMCGKNAKQMCSGCYKIYYCSTNCQTSDWLSHRIKCVQKSLKQN